MDDDTQFQDKTVTSVSPQDGGGWAITTDDGWSFYVPAGEWEPKEGSAARFYGRGAGYPVRGLVIDGKVAFYRSEESHAAYQDEQTYGASCDDLLERWDSGRGIWTVEMGGLSPGYEQAIQLTGMEILRVLLRDAPDASEWSDHKKWMATSDALNREVAPIVEKLGLSGAQWGAAVNIGTVFYRHGPVAAIKMVGDDRRIQCSKNFPSL